MSALRPFTFHVPDEGHRRPPRRACRHVFPTKRPKRPGPMATDLAYIRAGRILARKVSTGARRRARLNAFATVQGRPARHRPALHPCAGSGSRPVAAAALHGWPGSLFEFIDLIPRLTDPARFGGDRARAFTVIAPSLPGYGFLPARAKRFSIASNRRLFGRSHDRMSGLPAFRRARRRLGRARTASVGDAHPDELVGIHLNLVRRPGLPAPTAPAAEERRYHDDLRAPDQNGNRLHADPGHQPQTLAYGLTDSPAGRPWLAENSVPGPIATATSRRHPRDRHAGQYLASIGSPPRSAPPSGPITLVFTMTGLSPRVTKVMRSDRICGVSARDHSSTAQNRRESLRNFNAGRQ